jgi:hypothetical protein
MRLTRAEWFLITAAAAAGMGAPGITLRFVHQQCPEIIGQVKCRRCGRVCQEGLCPDCNYRPNGGQSSETVSPHAYDLTDYFAGAAIGMRLVAGFRMMNGDSPPDPDSGADDSGED